MQKREKARRRCLAPRQPECRTFSRIGGCYRSHRDCSGYDPEGSDGEPDAGVPASRSVPAGFGGPLRWLARERGLGPTRSVAVGAPRAPTLAESHRRDAR